MTLLEQVNKILLEQIALSDLKRSVLDKKVVRFNYDGKGTREAEIKLIGRTKKGNPAVRAYQMTGFTDTINGDWKIFLVGKMDNLEVLEKDHASFRPKYNKSGDKEFSKIIVQSD